MDISSFITWFLNQFYTIGVQIFNALDNITLAFGVSLLDFIITLTIISVFINIILTIPNNMFNHVDKKIESKQRKEKKNDNKSR